MTEQTTGFPELDEYNKLRVQIAELQAQADVLRDAAIGRARAMAQMLMAQHGLKLSDLVEEKNGKKPRKSGYTLPARFRDPVTGAEWSGKGREPFWIKGQDREQFRIAA